MRPTPSAATPAASESTRQTAMEVNRSLRTIKTELEALLEKGAISDDAFSTMHDLLPAEWSLRGPPPAAAAQKLPIRSAAAAPAAAAPAAAAESGDDHDRAAEEEDARGAAADERTAVGYATARYAYEAPNEGDVAFARGEAVAVYGKVNDDWWLGRNVRTGRVGIFPRQYVKPEAALAALERAGRLPTAGEEAQEEGGAAHDSTRQPEEQPPAQPPHPHAGPPSYYDAHGNPPAQPYQQQGYAGYGGQPGYAGYPPPQQPYGEKHWQQGPPAPAQGYYGAGPSSGPPAPPPQQQQQQQPQQQPGPEAKSTGKKIGGKLGNAFVTGVGFAAGAELLGAIL